MNPVDERFEHRLLDRFHYDDRQDGDGYGPDSPRVGDKGWIIWQTAFNELDRPFEIVRDEGRGRTGLPCCWSAWRTTTATTGISAKTMTANT